MELTNRQKDILEGIVSEYIKQACPVSSQMLQELHDFGVSPATLRNEMMFLSRQGFLRKPHASSGRVPTDGGYRFFVDEILEKKQRIEENSKLQEALAGDMPDALEFAAFGARNLAQLSSGLVAMSLESSGILWKEGWEELLEEPEFEDQGSIKSFARFLGDFEKNVQTLEAGSEIQVFIGKENPFSRINEFSIMIAGCDTSEHGKGIAAILGPKRMAYTKNIKALNAFKDIWKKNKRN
ncbi:MAG: hypothetical protein HYS60_01655 [Candidatus Wildermuthbacteria bacterium]|nr:hypothetical protein [Candidatus Wildermuthbacteria bacterium]